MLACSIFACLAPTRCTVLVVITVGASAVVHLHRLPRQLPNLPDKWLRKCFYRCASASMAASAAAKLCMLCASICVSIFSDRVKSGVGLCTVHGRVKHRPTRVLDTAVSRHHGYTVDTQLCMGCVNNLHGHGGPYLNLKGATGACAAPCMVT